MPDINPTTESLLTVTQASQQIPGRPHVATVWRWILKGLNGIKLGSVKVGGRRYTSAEAIESFIADSNAGNSSIDSSNHDSTRREQSIARAESELARDGI